MKKQHGMRVNLPQKQLKTKVTFEEPLVCALNVAMAGKDIENLDAEDTKRFTTQDCTHPLWPAFMPQCRACVLANKHEICMVDKKGHTYRKVK